MSKKFGLGKGLNALIPEDTNLVPSITKKETSDKNLIDINLIRSNIDQPRKTFDDEKIIANVLFSQLINIRKNIDDATLIVITIK